MSEIEKLKAENDDLRTKLAEARNQCWELADRIERQSDREKAAKRLLGSDYRHCWVRSDGLSGATPKGKADSETLRWYAGVIFAEILRDDLSRRERTISELDIVAATNKAWEYAVDFFERIDWLVQSYSDYGETE